MFTVDLQQGYLSIIDKQASYFFRYHHSYVSVSQYDIIWDYIHVSSLNSLLKLSVGRWTLALSVCSFVYVVEGKEAQRLWSCTYVSYLHFGRQTLALILAWLQLGEEEEEVICCSAKCCFAGKKFCNKTFYQQ